MSTFVVDPMGNVPVAGESDTTPVPPDTTAYAGTAWKNKIKKSPQSMSSDRRQICFMLLSVPS